MEINRGSSSDYRLRYKDRISSSREIHEILKYGTLIKCPYFNLYIKNSSRKRIAIIIKKFQKGTVDRNKIKRRIKEIYRNNKNLFNNDTIIKVKADLIKTKFIILRKQTLENYQI